MRLNSTPVTARPYPLTLNHYNFLKQEIKNWLDAGIICKSMSPWASATVVVDILLSWKMIEYTPMISLWFSCSACSGCTAKSRSDRLCCTYCRCSLYLAPWLLMLPSAIYALSSSPTDPLSSAHSSECLPRQFASNCCGLQLQLSSLLNWCCLPSDLV